MNHRGGVNGERLGASEAHGEARELQPHRQVPRRFVATGQLEGDHAAEAIHLLLSQFVLRVGGKSRVVHSLHSRVRLQEPGEGRGVAVVTRDPEGQRLQAARQQPGLEWMRDHAKDDERLPQRFDTITIADHQSGRHVAVSAEILGGAMHDEVDTVLKGPLINRRGERVIHARDDATIAGERGDSPEIRECQRWIRWSLHVDHPRLGPQRRLEASQVRLLDERRLDPVTRQPALQSFHRPDVVGLLSDHVVAALQQP